MGFPNFKGKHAEDSMISPQAFMDYQKTRGKYPPFKPPHGVILCYSRRLMDHVLENHDVSKADGYHANMLLLNETGGRFAIVGNFGIGAPVAVTVLEELIAFGVREFISIGMAGTLQKDISIGDLMICDRAIRDEGTSFHYLKASKYAYASKPMVGRIEKVLKGRKLPYFKGTSWTVDAPYRETVSEARHYQKEGVSTVEMEASALFAVAKYRKVELGAIFTISDSLAELEWKPNFSHGKTEQGIKVIFEVAVETLKRK